MKIWVTKYALTDGVYVCEGEISNNMAVVEWEGGLNGKAYFHGQDFHVREDAAKERVRAMVESKRKSIKKQLSRLEDTMRGPLRLAVFQSSRKPA